MNPIKLLNDWGIKSDYLFWAGFGSIALALATWGTSRAKPDDDKSQSDRWGIFVGHWVPSFFALGAALQHYEDHHTGRGGKALKHASKGAAKLAKHHLSH